MKRRGVAAVLGAGPHGQEIRSLLERAGHVVTMYDDTLKIRTVFTQPFVEMGTRPCSWATEPYLIGAVWPLVRRQIASKACGAVMHQDGSVTFPGAIVSPNARRGIHTHVLHNAVVSHGCKLGDFVTVCSGAVLCGEVTVEDDVFIGANATVIHGGITIGKGAVIGAGAVVTKDVPAGETVYGNPARPASYSGEPIGGLR